MIRGARPTATQWREAVAAASQKTGVGFTDIMRRSPRHQVSSARAYAFRILHEKGFSTTAIGFVAGYDHTTIMHGLRRLGEREHVLAPAPAPAPAEAPVSMPTALPTPEPAKPSIVFLGAPPESPVKRRHKDLPSEMESPSAARLMAGR